MSEISYYEIKSILPSEGKGLTLRASVCGNPPEEGRFTLFPGGESLRMKSARSDGAGRVLEVKGISRSMMKSEGILVSEDQPATEGRKALILWIKKPRATESMTLCLRDNPGLKSPARVSAAEGSGAVILSSRLPFVQIPGQIYTVSNGSQDGEFLLLMADPWSADELKKMKARLAKNKNFPGEEAVYSMNLRIRGAVALPPSLVTSDFDGALRFGSWAVMDRIYGKALSLMEKRSRSEEGLAIDDLPALTGLPLTLCREIAETLVNEGKLLRRKGYLINSCEDHRDFLSPMSRMWLEKLEAAGEEGLPIKESFPLGDRLQALERRGLLRAFESFVINEESYKRQSRRILEALPGDRDFEMTDIKGFDNLSRSRLLAFLQAMEDDGDIIKAEGHLRRVAPGDAG